jgi:hypothetical protein
MVFHIHVLDEGFHSVAHVVSTFVSIFPEASAFTFRVYGTGKFKESLIGMYIYSNLKGICISRL